MSKNLEIKARIQSVEVAISIAHNLNATYVGELRQYDTYFDTKHGRLKLRVINNDRCELIYYDRAETSTQRLSNFEVYPLNDAVALKKILESSIGIKAVVQKKRQLYLYQSTRIHIDEVVNLGSFLEFEAPVIDSLASAEQMINFLVRKFNIKRNDSLLHSYIDLMIGGS